MAPDNATFWQWYLTDMQDPVYALDDLSPSPVLPLEPVVAF